MRNLITILLVGGCLSLWAGAANATSVVKLHCSKINCQFTEEIGPSGTKTYQGYCDGTGNTTVTVGNSNMVCHKAKGLTCQFWGFDSTARYWSCTCTNWNATKRAHPDIDVQCPSPS